MSASPSYPTLPVESRRGTVEVDSLPPFAELDSITVKAGSTTTSSPVKRIFIEEDVAYWLKSKAHQQYLLFLARVARACIGKATIVPCERDLQTLSAPVQAILKLLLELDSWTKEIKAQDAPQRFGNLAFRTWGERLDEQIECLHRKTLPDAYHPLIGELAPYLAGSFGSFVRIDYGSGHELAFAAWLCFLRKAQFLKEEDEEAIGLRIIPLYLQVVWNLQDTYRLEPAGSHGVWGLDDFHFVPYIIGAAQLAAQSDYKPAQISSHTHRPAGGLQQQHVPPQELLAFVPAASSSSSFGAGKPPPLRAVDPSMPPPSSLLSTSTSRTALESPPPFCNLFTSSIARIHSLKRGPFAEHSPLLNDLAGSVPNWVKMFNGMLKMYDAECLGKRPVIQHFPFGETCFVWEGPIRQPPAEGAEPADARAAPLRAQPLVTATAPGTGSGSQLHSVTGAPWARTTRVPGVPAQAPLPPATSARIGLSSRAPPGPGVPGMPPATMAPTGAPWASAAPRMPGQPAPLARPTVASSGSAAANSSPFGSLPPPSSSVPSSRHQPKR